MEITITNATKYIGKARVLDDVTLLLHSGMIYGLQGPNGSGKTMLMRLISGLIHPTSGAVWVDNKKLGKDIDFPKSMGILIENPAFLNEYTGIKNLELLSQINKKVTTGHIRSILVSVNSNSVRKTPTLRIISEPE